MAITAGSNDDQRTGAKVTGKMVLKIAASLVVTAVCVFYALHGVDRGAVAAELRRLPLSAVLLYLTSVAVTHWFRSARWNYLLRPLGVSLPTRRLLPISSVGFMAILVLPIRLGELVRPYYVTRESSLRMTAAVGTVAVERIIDGLMISVFFFGSYLLAAPDVFSPQLRFGAWLSLCGFLALTSFLALALARTDATIGFLLEVSRLKRLAPLRAAQLEDRLRALISGFRVLSDGRNLALFLLQTTLYWGCNGLGMWLLAQKMGLDLGIGAAFTTMAFTGVVLTLPNSPGLVGQFHAGIKLGLMAFLPMAVVNSKGIAYAVVLHGLQTVWYVGTGLISLPLVSRGRLRRSFRETLLEANEASESSRAEPVI
jgi:glycosyltransferase 2 family protein